MWHPTSWLGGCRYAREDALGKLGSAVAEGAQLIEDLYQAFYLELQTPLLAQPTGSAPAPSADTHGQTGHGASESPKSEATAKVFLRCNPLQRTVVGSAASWS